MSKRPPKAPKPLEAPDDLVRPVNIDEALHDTSGVSKSLETPKLPPIKELSEGDLVNDRYKVVYRLAETDISRVYVAEDQRLGRKVVVKHLKKGSSTTEFSDLLKEAQVLSMLNHPNILTVYDSTMDEKGAYIITEYIQGETIDKFAHKRGLSPRVFTDIVNQMLEGLAEAHHHGIIHGDIKPNNIMCVMQPGNRIQVKILDFGLASFLNPMSGTERVETNMTGAAYFMAPEQFENHPTTIQSDLYSLGCVCYHAICKRYPFDGSDAIQIMSSHLQHLTHDVTSLRADFPEQLAQWIMWMINLRPETRPESAIYSSAVLSQCYQEHLATTENPASPTVSHAPANVPSHTTAWQAGMSLTQKQKVAVQGSWPHLKVHAQKALSKLVSKQHAILFMQKTMKECGLSTDSEVTPEMHRTIITKYFANVPNRAKQQALLTEMEVYF